MGGMGFYWLRNPVRPREKDYFFRRRMTEIAPSPPWRGWAFRTLAIISAKGLLSIQCPISARIAPRPGRPWEMPGGRDFPVIINRTRTPSIRSEEHTSELQSLMSNSYAVLCLKNKKTVIQKR